MSLGDIEELVDAIDAKLAGPGDDREKTSWPERAFVLAYSFDDHVRGQDFTSFVFEQSPEEWHETLAALREVGARGYAEVLARFITRDGEAFARQESAPIGGAGFEFSEDYDDALSEVRDGQSADSDTAYIESILEPFARRARLTAE